MCSSDLSNGKHTNGKNGNGKHTNGKNGNGKNGNGRSEAEVMNVKLAETIQVARLKGYEGDPCGECGNFTLVRNGTCLKCNTCGSTSGCS